MELVFSKFKSIIFISILLFTTWMSQSHAATAVSSIAITGVVTDSVTGKPIESVVVTFQKKKVGVWQTKRGIQSNKRQNF